MLSSLPSALLLDDGELGGVRALLDGLVAQVDHLRGKGTPLEVAASYDLVVSTARKAHALADTIDAAGDARRPVWIVVHAQDFLPLRARLRDLGVNYLVRPNVDPDVLRLLLLHALYRGPERRSAPRLLIGSRISCHSGGGWHPATLLDLTPEGCRLTSSRAAEDGAPVAVALPASLAGGVVLELSGRAVRVEQDEKGDRDGERRIVVEFDDLDADSARRLAAILEGKAIGTAVTPLAIHAGPPADSGDPLPRSEPGPTEIVLEKADRRRSVRVTYERKVTALAGEATNVILGRDLSVDGMRVEPRSDLPVGSEFRLAIYGSTREEPVVVRAFVTRDDGERGLAIRFHPDRAASRRLERVVSALPAIESLDPSEREPTPVVVSKTVPDGPD
jgi:hypothetical protein